MSVFKKLGALALILTVLPGFGSGERIFAPGIDPWPKWQAHDAASTRTIDHGAWTALLARHVRPSGGVNMVSYAAFSGADKTALKGYLDQLQGTPISGHNRDEQFAYWVNLYNALTVQVIVDHPGVASIRDIDISPGLISVGPWDKKLVTVEGEELSLNDIEHRILRAVWRDPRIHYAVNCASIGCPNLASKAWTARGLNAALDAAARDYINDPRGVSVRGDRITVSRIYDWFVEDFGGTEAGVIAHLTQYADPALAADLKRIGRLEDTAYDWSLNAAR